MDSRAYIFLIKEKSKTLERGKSKCLGEKWTGKARDWREEEGRGSRLSHSRPRLSVCDRLGPISLCLFLASGPLCTAELSPLNGPPTLRPSAPGGGSSRWGPGLGPVLADLLTSG